MKIKKFFSIFIITTLLVSTALAGCGKKEEVSSESASFSGTVSDKIMEESAASRPEDAEPAQAKDAEPVQTEDTDKEVQALTITALNFTNIRIGMFSVIDPVTNQQINVAGMEPGESISLECNWPVNTTSFQWALYNQAGELCIDASTDITGANKTVALALTGDTTVENVEVGME